MPQPATRPDVDTANRIARWMGPGLLLLLLAAWGSTWLLPERDRQRFVDAQAEGRIELPPAPPPDRDPGIDNRVLDPALRSAAAESNPDGPSRPMSMERLGPPGGGPPGGGPPGGGPRSGERPRHPKQGSEKGPGRGEGQPEPPHEAPR
jgi:hypothetical protein